MKQFFLIAFCLMTINGFGQTDQITTNNRNFKTFYDAIIVKNDGDTVIGKMRHFKYLITKVSIYVNNEKNRLKKKKVRGTEIDYLMIDGEYYGAVETPTGITVLSHRIINESGFEVFKTLGQMGGYYTGANGIVKGTQTSNYNIYYLNLDNKIYELSDDWYERNNWRGNIYTIFSKYDYFKSNVDFASLDDMSMEEVISLYHKLRKEHERQ